MAKPTKHTLTSIAEALVQQNPELTAIVNDNPGQSYKLIEAMVKPMMRTVAEALGSYTKTQALVWAIINVVNESGTSTRLQLKL